MEPPGRPSRFGKRVTRGWLVAANSLEFPGLLDTASSRGHLLERVTITGDCLALSRLGNRPSLRGPIRATSSGTPLQCQMRVAAEGHHQKESAP